ncbi:SRPBCC domain-containing protein [Sphingomonas crusticola]|uniref:SRPBCC domain-containing protein n=1 Tax=Sphingomonas crusticola TaxID=1697973 RepID=UPI0013C352A4|nr:SRPBCC domain-containing protein [Sphingomonas crusticola]
MTDVAYSGTSRTLQLTRDYPHPIAKVWAAVSTPARIADWMGVEWLGDEGAALHEGAHFDYRFGAMDMESRAHVLRYEPPHLLEHSWFENVPPFGRVRWALEEVDGGTRLTLTHVLPVFEEAPRTGAGWTVLMEQLAASLGDAPATLDWCALRDEYARRFGPEATRDGRLVPQGDRQTLTFDRILHHSPETVWDVLTTPAGISRWWQADAVVDPHVGGRFELLFREFGHRLNGAITCYDPPRRFGFTWPEGAAGKDSEVLFELSPDAAGTHLRLIHDLPGDVAVIGFAAGWHWHLDGMDDAARNVATEWDGTRFQMLRKVYGMTL